MRLSKEWFTALSEDEKGQLVTVCGREELTEFVKSGKFKERVEISWKFEGDEKGMPSDELAEKMESVQEAMAKAMEKDKLRKSGAAAKASLNRAIVVWDRPETK